MLVVTAAELNPGLCESVMGDPRRTPRFNYLLRLTGFSICYTNSCDSLHWKNAQQNWQRGDTEVTVWGNGQASTATWMCLISQHHVGMRYVRGPSA